MEETVIEQAGKPIEDSLIGRSVELRGHDGSTYRMVLGDFSRARVP
jgi:hypothetical protein